MMIRPCAICGKPLKLTSANQQKFLILICETCSGTNEEKKILNIIKELDHSKLNFIQKQTYLEKLGYHIKSIRIDKRLVAGTKYLMHRKFYRGPWQN